MHRGIQDYGLLISGITVASLLFGSAAVAAERVDAVYTDGNVGIDATGPQTMLHVKGTVHVDGTDGVDGIMFPDGSLQTTAT